MLVDANKEVFERITLFGHPALFTNLRVGRDTVPEGYHAYDVRHDDDQQGIPIELARFIFVNHWGTVISSKEIELHDYGYASHNGYRDIGEDDWNYEGKTISLEKYMEEYPPEKGMI